jgi:hypothetical protein
LILAQDLGYGNTDAEMNSLEEASRLRMSKPFWLLTPDF